MLAAKVNADIAVSKNIPAAEGRVMQLCKGQPNQGRNEAFFSILTLFMYRVLYPKASGHIAN